MNEMFKNTLDTIPQGVLVLNSQDNSIKFANNKLKEKLKVS